MVTAWPVVANIVGPVRAERRNGLSWLLVDATDIVVAERLNQHQAEYLALLVNADMKRKAEQEADRG